MKWTIEVTSSSASAAAAGSRCVWPQVTPPHRVWLVAMVTDTTVQTFPWRQVNDDITVSSSLHFSIINTNDRRGISRMKRNDWIINEPSDVIEAEQRPPSPTGSDDFSAQLSACGPAPSGSAALLQWDCVWLKILCVVTATFKSLKKRETEATERRLRLWWLSQALI